ncbi:MAG: hypothetical protein HY898_14280 [Deltaproteobacteria bacterium]|nr:hypothetical protein [Deltaproteobacteria bacterium]
MKRPALSLILLAATHACRQESASDALPTQPLVPSTGTQTASSTPPARPSSPMPQPARGRLESAVALNKKCESCHEVEAAQWNGSRHKQASTNAAFQKGFSLEPRSFCSDCHAAESAPGKPVPRAVSDIGVACVTCHVTEPGWVLAALSRGNAASDKAAEAAHPLRRSAELSQSPGCAACHEFRFPGRWDDDEEAFMQTTVREHALSRTASVGCPVCHMPLENGRRSHAFSQVRDAAWLKEHLQVQAERSGTGLVITLTQSHGGHGFPTGDIFRRLEVGCETLDAQGKGISRDAQYLARHFGSRPGRWDMELLSDDRVFDEPRVVECNPVPQDGRNATSARWWVTLQRVVLPSSRANAAGGTIDSEVELHTGVVPWQSK